MYPEYGFKVANEMKESLLGVMLEGKFTSYYKGKASPLLKDKGGENKDSKSDSNNKEKDLKGVITSIVEKSPNISRLIVFSSNEFVADDTTQFISMIKGNQYSNTFQLIENTLDWSLEDRSLLSIRSRSHFARTLYPMSDSNKNWYEMMNYLFALLGVVAVFLLAYGGKRKIIIDMYRSLK